MAKAKKKKAAKKKAGPAKKAPAKKAAKKAPAKKAAKKAPAKKAPAKKAAKKKSAKKKSAKRPAGKKRTATKKTVDQYVAGLSGWQSVVAQALRLSARKAAPDARESFKWGQPVYEDHGPFAYFKAFANQVNFGFWRGAEMADPHALLEGEGDRMRHVTIRRPEELKPQYLEELIREAVTLNRAKGDPTKR